MAVCMCLSILVCVRGKPLQLHFCPLSFAFPNSAFNTSFSHLSNGLFHCAVCWGICSAVKTELICYSCFLTYGQHFRLSAYHSIDVANGANFSPSLRPIASPPADGNSENLMQALNSGTDFTRTCDFFFYAFPRNWWKETDYKKYLNIK